MKRILRSTAILAASVASLIPTSHSRVEPAKQKKLHARRDLKPPVPGGHIGPDRPNRTVSLKRDRGPFIDLAPAVAAGFAFASVPPHERTAARDRYPWKQKIVTTTFWIGEKPTKNNPVPNHKSSWDEDWAKNYGGTDTPDPELRMEYRPASFVPGQNPFYVALPYNDVQSTGHKPEAEKVIPWFKEDFRGAGKTVCKGRWLAIRFKDRVAYAQWEDCGPFRTDHSAYVFGEERPRPNLNKGAGLDVSPAVRDFLGMNDTDVTDWKFVDFDEVPQGPWARYGDNNTFVINRRLNEQRLAALLSDKPAPE
jgi:hypothetical protein